jgi:nucleoid-associated protein YgaU
MGSLVTSLGSQLGNALSGGKTPTYELFSIGVEKSHAKDSPPLSNIGEPILCQFNPASLHLSQSSNWDIQGQGYGSQGNLHFIKQNAQTLSFDLYFDTTEANPSEQSKSTCAADSDVRVCTAPITSLVQIVPALHRPPVCALSWGGADPTGKHVGNWFNGVASNIGQEFTYFDTTGKPQRAKVHCEFTSFMAVPPAQQPQSNDVNKAYVVKRGDTLAGIAQEQMHDASLWRTIAIANGITDPLTIQPGRVLQIPTVDRL